MPASPHDPAASDPRHPSGSSQSHPQGGEQGASTPGHGLPLTYGSTGSHHPSAAQESLSELLRSTDTSRRAVTSSDVLQLLNNPAIGSPANTDESPTVITPKGTLVPSPSSATLAPAEELPTVAGRRLGHFELIEAIGAGGMAAVLKARDLELGRIVALKILPPEAAHDPESVNRFKQEARAAALLDHENVARVYYCGEDQNLHFIAFEFVEGDNLRVQMDRRGLISAADSIRYMIQVAAGLKHAAERGVVHRDIKPSNIIITPDGRAKIVDMGLARHLESQSINGGVTQSGVTLGTFDYISPEQALDPRRADVRSDLYSLGCTFYHALTGRPPVPEGTAAKKLQAHQSIDPLDPRELNPAIPDELAAVLARMMAKNIETRYQTPTELISHLKGLAEQLRLGSDVVPFDSTVQAVPANPAVLPKVPRLRIGWVVAAAAVAIAATLFAISINGEDAHTPTPPWNALANNPLTPEPVEPPTIKPAQPNPPLPASNGTIVRTVKELADRLASAATSRAPLTRIQFGPGTFNLLELPDGITFLGQELELIGSPNHGTTIVVGARHVEGLTNSTSGVLAIKADAFTARGIRFEIRPDPLSSPFEVLRPFRSNAGRGGAIVLQCRNEVALTDCVFLSRVPPADEGVAVTIASPPEASVVRVRVLRCLFAQASGDRSGAALAVPAHSDVTIEDCGFTPHVAAVQVRPLPEQEEPRAAPATAIRLSRSSFLLDARSAVVSASDSVAVTAGYCVFAPASVVTLNPDPLAVVLAAPNLETRFTFNGLAGQKNAYYRVNPLGIVSENTTTSYSFAEAKIAGLSVEDRDAIALSQRPWAELDPLRLAAGNNPWRAFRLRLSDSLLFTPRDPLVRLLGAQFHDELGSPPRRAYPEVRWPPDLPQTVATNTTRQLIWEPNATEPLPKDTYSDLAFLLKNARSGDEVLIKHTGELPVERQELKPRGGTETANFRLLFKPYPGSRPILTAGGGRELNQALFQVLNGRVSFEKLQFRLQPSRPRDPQRVAAVQIVGGDSATFTECVFTLTEEDEAQSAVVLINDPDLVMAMDGITRPVPKVKFDRCVVRGRGRGVWVPVSRAVDVEVTQTLTALDGPVFLAEPSGKVAPGAKSSLRLQRVTALIGGPVVQLHGGKVGIMRVSGLVPLDVQADECLFAAVPTAGRPIVECDGFDPVAEKMLEWQVRTANRYANFDVSAAVAVIRSGMEMSMPKEWDWNQWIAFSGEPPAAGTPVGRVMFEQGPTGLRDLLTITPRDVTVTAVEFPDLIGALPSDAGVDVKLLPVPTTGSRPE